MRCGVEDCRFDGEDWRTNLHEFAKQLIHHILLPRTSLPLVVSLVSYSCCSLHLCLSTKNHNSLLSLLNCICFQHTPFDSVHRPTLFYNTPPMSTHETSIPQPSCCFPFAHKKFATCPKENLPPPLPLPPHHSLILWTNRWRL